MPEESGRPIVFIASSAKDLKKFPQDVADEVAFALLEASLGRTPAAAKPLKGFPGATTVESGEDDDGNTYRAAYAVRFKDAVYVLHCFQKSKSGIATPKKEIDLVKRRLAWAEQISKERPEHHRKETAGDQQARRGRA